MTDILVLIGRLLFGGLFLYNGINHFQNRAAMTGYAAYKGVPMPSLSIVGSGLWLVVCGLSVILGFRPGVGLLMCGDLPGRRHAGDAQLLDRNRPERPAGRLDQLPEEHGAARRRPGLPRLLALPRPWPVLDRVVVRAVRVARTVRALLLDTLPASNKDPSAS